MCSKLNWNVGKKGNYTVVILGQDDERVKKLHSVLADYDIEAAELFNATAFFQVKYRFYAAV